MFEKIRIVLVETSHPGNIGSAARAMKTMGLQNLYLVAPHHFPDRKAIDLASGALDILENAKVVSSIHEAIKDCTLVVGTSTRSRTIPWPMISPRDLATQIKKDDHQQQIAILFGREQSGLSNEELHQCHLHVQIPANPAYSSLNLAAAVQVIAYELRIANLSENIGEEWDFPKATVDDLDKFFTHLQEVLVEIDFLKLNAPRRLMTRMRRLFLRARPDTMEINMLRGMLAAIQEVNSKGED